MVVEHGKRRFFNPGNPLILVDPHRKDINVAHFERFVGRVQRLVGIRGQVEILITGNRRLQELNWRFRKKNRPTDVLSFPRSDKGGDVAISAEIAAENAVRYGHSLVDELKVLILHGMLHLAGYDHERDNGEMATNEHRLRGRLGLPSALIERTKVSPQRARRRPEAEGQKPGAGS